MHYVDGLSSEQIQDFLIALSFVMHSDGDASKEEEEYIKVASTAYGLDSPNLADIMKKRSLAEVENIVAWAKNKPETARYMIREMISLAISDGDILEAEIDAIFHIGKVVGVSEERVNDIITWAVEGYEWQMEGFRLVEEDE